MTKIYSISAHGSAVESFARPLAEKLDLLRRQMLSVLPSQLQELIYFFSPEFTENTEAAFVSGATKWFRQKITGA